MKKSVPPSDIFIGKNNVDLTASRDRLIRGGTYKDLSTICIVATRGVIPAKVVQAWMGLATPMNQKFMRIFVEKMEVGDAYNAGIEMVLGNADLSQWKYVLTMEEDNIPPPDGLLKLYEAMERFDAVGGLYWTKGENGQPMIYGNPQEMPMNFVPQLPIPDRLQPCNGLGMGFTLFKLEMFKKMPKPWFKTLQEIVPGQGMQMATQDLYFFMNASKNGYRFASDNRVRVGHYDHASNTTW